MVGEDGMDGGEIGMDGEGGLAAGSRLNPWLALYGLVI